MKGGTIHSQCTVCRYAVPPRGVPGFHELDARRVSAAGPALRGRIPSPYGGVAPRWETPGPPASLACIRTRMVKKLMRLRARSISGAPRAVHDTEWDLDILGFGRLQGRAVRCPCLDDSARDENAPQTASGHDGATRPQTG